MSFGRLGALGRGFGRLGSGGKRSAPVIPGVISAGVGSYTITGMAAGLVASHVPLAAALGTFTITGQDATLTYASVGGGTTGQPMGLLLSLTYAS